MPVVSHSVTPLAPSLVDVARAPVEHRLHRHVALHRAAEGARQRDVDRRAGAARDASPPRPVPANDCSRVMRRLARLWRLGGRHHEVELVGARVDGALGAAHVGHQRAVDDAGHALDLAQHLLGVAQRGDRLRRDEGGDLDLGHAGARQRVDQRDLVVGRHEGRLDLQAVARADLLHVDAPARAVPELCVHATTFELRRAAMSSAAKPISASTASVSSPSRGAEERMRARRARSAWARCPARRAS